MRRSRGLLGVKRTDTYVCGSTRRCRNALQNPSGFTLGSIDRLSSASIAALQSTLLQIVGANTSARLDPGQSMVR